MLRCAIRVKGLTVGKYPQVALSSFNHALLESAITPVDDFAIRASVLEEDRIQEILRLKDMHVSRSNQRRWSSCSECTRTG